MSPNGTDDKRTADDEDVTCYKVNMKYGNNRRSIGSHITLPSYSLGSNEAVARTDTANRYRAWSGLIEIFGNPKIIYRLFITIPPCD